MASSAVSSNEHVLGEYIVYESPRARFRQELYLKNGTYFKVRSLKSFFDSRTGQWTAERSHLELDLEEAVTLNANTKAALAHFYTLKAKFEKQSAKSRQDVEHRLHREPSVTDLRKQHFFDPSTSARPGYDTVDD